MIECLKNLILSETFLTVVGGSLVFVFGQLFNEYWLRPIQKYKELRVKIAYELTLYAYLYMNPVVKVNEYITDESYELRKLAAEVDAMIELKLFASS